MEQLSFFPNPTPVFPTTRYQGSKSKLAGWIWAQLQSLDFHTFLDAFGGTGVISFQAKLHHKQVVYNDLLKFNAIFGQGLIENKGEVLSGAEVDWLLTRHAQVEYRPFVQNTFDDIYFSNDENHWIDQTIANIYQLKNPYRFAIAFFALCQACIIKRPYNLFHRKNLYLRLADVKRSFGNKATWDRPFVEWFRWFVAEANRAAFDNGQPNQAFNFDACDVPGSYDLVYLDPPYLSQKGTPVNYRDFYHFLEGLASYYSWPEKVDFQSKHRRLLPEPNDWASKKTITAAFDRLFARYQDSLLVVSYRSDGVPSLEEIEALLKKYKHRVSVLSYGDYKYVLSKNGNSRETLFIAT